jgi:rubrerythrin
VSQGKLTHDSYQENVASELDNLLSRLQRYEMEMEDYHVSFRTRFFSLVNRLSTSLRLFSKKPMYYAGQAVLLGE